MRNDAFKEQEKISLVEVLLEIPYFVAVVFSVSERKSYK